MTLRELFLSRKRPLVIGHRGAMGHEPENTMRSFRRALQLGADLIELDVHLSSDGALVVMHDETLDRTTNGRGLIVQKTLAELQQLDAGKGERIPTLEQVLEWARGAGICVDIELKTGPVTYPGIEARVAEALARAQMTERAVVISFDHHAVKRMREADDRLITGILYAARPVDPIAMARAAGAEVLAPHYGYVHAEDITLAHEAGLVVAPWVTSDAEVARRLFAAGVDALGSNHPDVIRRVAEEQIRE